MDKLSSEEREQSFDIKLEDIEKILDKDFSAHGSTARAIEKLRNILNETK